MSKLRAFSTDSLVSPLTPSDGLTGDLRRYHTLLGDEEEQRASAWVTGEKAQVSAAALRSVLVAVASSCLLA